MAGTSSWHVTGHPLPSPKDTDSYYSSSRRSGKGYNQVHPVALYDLLGRVYTDAAIQPIWKKNEFAALSGLVDRHTPHSGTVPIFIADRGFHAYNVFAHAIEKGAFFVIRAASIKTGRLLGADLPEEEYEISLRVLCFPIGDGIYENIITNLPEDEFGAEEIKGIYRLRWGIETSFCTLKHTIAAVNLHSKNSQMIAHEVWARLILFNFCSYITGQVVFGRQKRKHIHQVNFTVAFQNLCPPSKVPSTNQFYIPFLTDRVIIPYGRHFCTCLFVIP